MTSERRRKYISGALGAAFLVTGAKSLEAAVDRDTTSDAIRRNYDIETVPAPDNQDDQLQPVYNQLLQLSNEADGFTVVGIFTTVLGMGAIAVTVSLHNEEL